MKWCKLELTDTDGRELFKGHIPELPLSEKNIKFQSKIFFDDEEPCFIHRSAVLNRIYNELNDYFMQSASSGKEVLTANNLPAKIKQYLDIFETAEIIVFTTK